MLFDPNGEGRESIGPLYIYLGPTVLWPERVVQAFQRCVVHLFCLLWRALIHRFDCYPWLLAPVFHGDVPEEHRQDQARQFWDAEDCCVDLWMGQALRGTLCDNPGELLEEALSEFIGIMFSRCMVTSIFAEKQFSPMTTWTSGPKSRFSLHGLAARSLNATFTEVVGRLQRPQRERE